MGATCSALYVVDLVKFRETAAGDQLRVFYETLSKDPNSLSNLDQVSEHIHWFSHTNQTFKLLLVDGIFILQCSRFVHVQVIVT